MSARFEGGSRANRKNVLSEELGIIVRYRRLYKSFLLQVSSIRQISRLEGSLIGEPLLEDTERLLY